MISERVYASVLLCVSSVLLEHNYGLRCFREALSSVGEVHHIQCIYQTLGRELELRNSSAIQER